MSRVDLGSKAGRETEVTPGIVNSTSRHSGVGASGDVAQSSDDGSPHTAGGVDEAAADSGGEVAGDVVLSPAYRGRTSTCNDKFSSAYR